MGYVENLMGDSERVVYRTHQHIIVLLGRVLVSLLIFILLLGLGLAVLLPKENDPGNQVRFAVGLVLLVCLAIPIYLIASAWVRGERGRDFVGSIWFAALVGLVILVLSIVIMLNPHFRLLGWIGVVVAVIPLVEMTRIFLDWLNERYIITNRRVMEVRGTINKHVRDSALEKVNDVDLKQSVVGRILRYGSVQIITGSDIGVNRFRRISNPVRFKRAMLNAKEQLQTGSKAGEPTISGSVMPAAGAMTSGSSSPASADIPDLIEELDDLRQKGILSEKEFQAKKDELLDRL
jgi:hypothetical protein